MDYRILVINPGSTSTKIGVYENERLIFVKGLQHSTEELAPFKEIKDQFQFRKNVILNTLKENGIDTTNFNVIMGRGGLVKPIPSGVYEVNELMLKHLAEGYSGQHASNLGGIIASDIASNIPGCKAFIADPVVVDEMMDIARVSGMPELPRQSIFHALNQKAMARVHARNVCRDYEDLNLIVVHMGGGISIGAHQKGQVIDVNDALDGEGPFSPERAGSVALLPFAKLCFSGKYTFDQIKKMINGKGGMVAFLGTNSFKEVSDKAEGGDKNALLVFEALAYQIAKYIGSAAASLSGEVDGIIFTGGMAHNRNFVETIIKRIKFIAPCFRYPGEDELGALASNALSVLRGEQVAKIYK